MKNDSDSTPLEKRMLVYALLIGAIIGLLIALDPDPPTPTLTTLTDVEEFLVLKFLIPGF